MRDLAAIWLYVADSSCRGYSPLYDRICRTVAESDEVLDLVSEAPPRGHNPVLLLAAVHYLLLGGLDHPLAAVYAGESDADPGPLFVDLCLQHRDALLELLATEQVNTNEVGRSAVIGPALTAVAARLAAPLGHVDVGCSAGLNLLCDRYRLDYGPAGATGPVDAPVKIRCDVVGGSPPIAPALPTITARIGLDRAPLDVHDPQQSRWQLACVWPDTGRLDADQARARGGTSQPAQVGAWRRRRGRRRTDRRPSARCHCRGDDDLGRGLLLPRAADRLPRRARRRPRRRGRWRGSARRATESST